MHNQGWLHDVIANQRLPMPVLADRTGFSNDQMHILSASSLNLSSDAPGMSSVKLRFSLFDISLRQVFGRSTELHITQASKCSVDSIFYSNIVGPDYCILAEALGVYNNDVVSLGWGLLPFVNSQIPRGFAISLLKGSSAIVGLLSRGALRDILSQRNIFDTCLIGSSLTINGYLGIRLTTRYMTDSPTDIAFRSLVPHNYLITAEESSACIRQPLLLPGISIVDIHTHRLQTSKHHLLAFRKDVLSRVSLVFSSHSTAKIISCLSINLSLATLEPECTKTQFQLPLAAAGKLIVEVLVVYGSDEYCIGWRGFDCGDLRNDGGASMLRGKGRSPTGKWLTLYNFELSVAFACEHGRSSRVTTCAGKLSDSKSFRASRGIETSSADPSGILPMAKVNLGRITSLEGAQVESGGVAQSVYAVGTKRDMGHEVSTVGSIHADQLVVFSGESVEGGDRSLAKEQCESNPVYLVNRRGQVQEDNHELSLHRYTPTLGVNTGGSSGVGVIQEDVAYTVVSTSTEVLSDANPSDAPARHSEGIFKPGAAPAASSFTRKGVPRIQSLQLHSRGLLELQGDQSYVYHAEIDGQPRQVAKGCQVAFDWDDIDHACVVHVRIYDVSSTILLGEHRLSLPSFGDVALTSLSKVTYVAAIGRVQTPKTQIPLKAKLKQLTGTLGGSRVTLRAECGKFEYLTMLVCNSSDTNQTVEVSPNSPEISVVNDIDLVRQLAEVKGLRVPPRSHLVDQGSYLLDAGESFEIPLKLLVFEPSNIPRLLEVRAYCNQLIVGQIEVLISSADFPAPDWTETLCADVGSEGCLLLAADRASTPFFCIFGIDSKANWESDDTLSVRFMVTEPVKFRLLLYPDLLKCEIGRCVAVHVCPRIKLDITTVAGLWVEKTTSLAISQQPTHVECPECDDVVFRLQCGSISVSARSWKAGDMNYSARVFADNWLVAAVTVDLHVIPPRVSEFIEICLPRDGGIRQTVINNPSAIEQEFEFTVSDPAVCRVNPKKATIGPLSAFLVDLVFSSNSADVFFYASGSVVECRLLRLVEENY